MSKDFPIIRFFFCVYSYTAALDRGRYARFAAFLKERGMLETVLPTESYAVELER